MRKHILFLLVACVLLACSEARAAKRVALVVGNGAYTASPLKNPVNDARDVASALGRLGFEVILKTDADRRAMIKGVSSFGRKAQDAEIALFFYAGHGMQVKGVNYLIPVGANVTNERDVEFEAMQADRVLSQMEGAGAKVNLVILDACRDNPFNSFRSQTRGLAVVRAVTGSVIVYATSPGDVAADGSSGRNSPFTENFLRHVATPGLTVKAMFDRVGAGVARASDGSQIPWVSSSLFEDVYLAQGAPSGNTWTDPATGMEFVWVPGGCFQMGLPSSEGGQEDEDEVHEVCVDGFWMGKYEVTRGQFREFVRRSGYRSDAETSGRAYDFRYIGFMEEEGSFWDSLGIEQDDRHPVVAVTGNDAMAYARWLSGKGRGTFRLPTEAEWEYAARAGTTTAYHWGADPDQACGYGNVHDRTSKKAFELYSSVAQAHNCDDGYAGTAPVGSFKPNALGLHDMLGNAWEWCADVYVKDAYYRHSRQNPLISDEGPWRVRRGGSFLGEGLYIRSGRRDASSQVESWADNGFRLVRTK